MKRYAKTLVLTALTAIIGGACTPGGDNGTPVPDSGSGSSTEGTHIASADTGSSKEADPASSETKGAGSSAAEDKQTYKKCISEIAAQADDTVIDGWFFGQDPRMFKSFYRKIPPDQKADFALAYHEWLMPFKQDLVADFKTYVPYSKRADFAFEWWGKKVPRFGTQEKKLQVLWAHESIQDASELWWRASEKLGKIPANSALMLAHDQEQKMVAHYMEDEGSPGSLSDQVWKRTHGSNGSKNEQPKAK